VHFALKRGSPATLRVPMPAAARPILQLLYNRREPGSYYLADRGRLCWPLAGMV